MEWTTILVLVVIVGMMACSVPFAMSLANTLGTLSNLLNTLGNAAAGIINLIDGAIQKVLDSCQEPGVFTACHIFAGVGLLGFVAWFLGKTVPLFKSNTPEPPRDGVSARLAAIESAISSRPLDEVRRTQARDQIAQTEAFTSDFEQQEAKQQRSLTPEQRNVVNEMGARVAVTKQAKSLFDTSKGTSQEAQAKTAFETSSFEARARADDIVKGGEIEMQELRDKVKRELPLDSL